MRIERGFQFGRGERAGCADGVEHQAVDHGEQQPGLQGGVERGPPALGRGRRAQRLLQIGMDCGERFGLYGGGLPG